MTSNISEMLYHGDDSILAATLSSNYGLYPKSNISMAAVKST